MPVPRYEFAVGGVDGVNVNFSAPGPYVADSLQVFVDGVVLPETWTELVPGLGTFSLDDPPALGQVVRVFFLDSSQSLIQVEEVCGIEGTLIEIDEIIGTLEEVDTLEAVIEVCDET